MKILFLLATLTVLASCTKAPAATPTPTPETKVMEEPKAMTEDTMAKPEAAMPVTTPNPEVAAPVAPTNPVVASMDSAEKLYGYTNYDEAKVKDALAKGQKVALFFHATWCPSCKSLDRTINREMSSIPADSLIVKVDYDSSTEMKKKYGVTNQHTIVLIDKDMNLISKKLGANTIAEVLN